MALRREMRKSTRRPLRGVRSDHPQIRPNARQADSPKGFSHSGSTTALRAIPRARWAARKKTPRAVYVSAPPLNSQAGGTRWSLVSSRVKQGQSQVMDGSRDRAVPALIRASRTPPQWAQQTRRAIQRQITDGLVYGI